MWWALSRRGKLSVGTESYHPLPPPLLRRHHRMAATLRRCDLQDGSLWLTPTLSHAAMNPPATQPVGGVLRHAGMNTPATPAVGGVKRHACACCTTHSHNRYFKKNRLAVPEEELRLRRMSVVNPEATLMCDKCYQLWKRPHQPPSTGVLPGVVPYKRTSLRAQSPRTLEGTTPASSTMRRSPRPTPHRALDALAAEAFYLLRQIDPHCRAVDGA